MVCRTRPGEALSLGFCRPGCEGEKPGRFAVAANAAMISRIERPPLWKMDPGKASFTVRLIGSGMWDQLTGERYCRADSDIDLVVDLDSSFAASAAVDFLAEVVTQSTVAIDAELSFPGVGEIHWKEWRSASPQLLIKSLHEARLIARGDLP